MLATPPTPKAHGVVGISTAEQGRHSVFYASLAGMQRPDGVVVAFARGSCISKNRNDITQTALDTNADWVLYLDDDHILRQDTLLRLLAADKDVVSAHYVQRQPPFNPVLMDTELEDGRFVYKQLRSDEQGLVEVAATGAGCLLVRTSVIRAMEKPYWTLGQINPASWGDDLHFCSRVRKAGFSIWCDLDAYIGHVMPGVVWPQRDNEIGWAAYFAQDPMMGPLVKFAMPLPGDGLVLNG